MLYDGDCPLCMREVDMLKRRVSSGLAACGGWLYSTSINHGGSRSSLLVVLLHCNTYTAALLLCRMRARGASPLWTSLHQTTSPPSMAASALRRRWSAFMRLRATAGSSQVGNAGWQGGGRRHREHLAAAGR